MTANLELDLPPMDDAQSAACGAATGVCEAMSIRFFHPALERVESFNSDVLEISHAHLHPTRPGIRWNRFACATSGQWSARWSEKSNFNTVT
ncbi:hypothetical protein ZHAS_00004274 [Anopheles sinensis]|uniref:Uncharacterized protein n=1 Tax=Anopheles sinensis TaxID=74873 RepID=A0A084VGH2_ANOSI|nr:hypothetical protein ZHAS_00004274 [Anopheles sinensis]